MITAFDRRETLAASIARMDRLEAGYFQERAANNTTLATLAFEAGDMGRAATFQRAAAYFAAEAHRLIPRLLEAA
jgi:hypothetical protein